MKKSRFSDKQIFDILQQHEGGQKTADICREHGISSGTFYKWKSKYGGMDMSLLQEHKALEQENQRLKKIVADQALDNQILREVNSKKW